MRFCDFAIKYDPEKDTSKDVCKKVLSSIILTPIKHNKPVYMFISGSSGDGKSWSGLKIQELLFQLQGLDPMQYFLACNIFTPLEYAQKLDALLFDKELKKVNILCMHEAREVIKAKLWYSFLNQSISDVNAMSRSVKRLCFIIISQFIRDISNDVRYTLNYYIKARRPLGKPTRLYFYVLWKDDNDIEKPKLRKRRLSGYLVYPDGHYRRFMPEYFEVSRPQEDIIELFEKTDREAKTLLIRKKMEELIKEMKADLGEHTNKVNVMLKWYLESPDRLELIGKQKYNKFVLHTEFKEMHDLSKMESIDFQDKLNAELKKRGAINDEQRNEPNGNQEL